jgi:excisionase family DNA binding protein
MNVQLVIHRGGWVRPSTIYDWAAAGRLPCLRLRGRLRFLRGDVARWIEAQKES